MKKKINKIKRQLAEFFLLIVGIFLFLDSVLFHGITFNYSVIGVTFLDRFISHGILGLIFIIIALVDIYYYGK